jgi:hypothetical protein
MVCCEVFEVFTAVSVEDSRAPPLTVEQSAQHGLWRKFFDRECGGLLLQRFEEIQTFLKFVAQQKQVLR